MPTAVSCQLLYMWQTLTTSVLQLIFLLKSSIAAAFRRFTLVKLPSNAASNSLFCLGVNPVLFFRVHIKSNHVAKQVRLVNILVLISNLLLSVILNNAKYTYVSQLESGITIIITRLVSG